MKSRSIAWVMIFGFLFATLRPELIFAQGAPKGEPKKIFVAILELDNKGGMTNAECSLLSDTIRQEFFSSNRYRVVDRNNMDQILKEQGFQLQDCTSQECAVQVGKLLGVEKMVVGTVGKLGQIFVVSLQLINVETGEIDSMASDKCPCTVEELLDQIKTLAQRISGGEKTAALEKTKLGSLEISASVSNALVYLNGKMVGSTPLAPQSLSPGRYEIRISKEGYAEWKKSAEIKAGSKSVLQAQLEKATGESKPWYKKPLPWIVIVVLVGGGATAAVLLTRGGGGQKQNPTGNLDLYY